MTFGGYVVLHFVNVYQISRCHIPKGDHKRAHIILRHPDLPEIQEISYSNVNLGKEWEDMQIALSWINVEWCTFVVYVVNLTFAFCSSLLCFSLSFCKAFFIFSFSVCNTSFSMLLCNSKIFCVNDLDFSPLTDSYLSNKLSTHLLLFVMTYSSFLFQNTILVTNIKTLSSGMWPLEDM